MTTTIRAYKGLVTKRNDVALNWLQESAQLLQRIEQGGVAAQRERAKEITMDITTCEEYIELLEASVTKLTKAFDGLQDATDEEEDQLDKLVVFTDASQYAIAACAYLTSQEESNIIMAKSKLPSIKTSMTIPKLEMNALTLGVRMSCFICEMLEPSCKIKEVILYTDSDIVLGWIRTPPSRQSAGILVTNRLSEIRRISNDLRSQSTTCLFGHVSTAENPADCGTRGLSAEALQNHIWWTGPEFTNKPDHSKLSTVADFEQSTMMSVEAVTLNSSEEVSKDEVIDLSRYSTLEKAQRVLVYALRFINRSLSHFPHERRLAIQQHIPALKEIPPSQTITGIEMHESRMCLIRDHQKNYVNEHQIKSQKELNIRQDEKGILRCYGRLQQADVPVTAKTPIYIAPKTINASYPQPSKAIDVEMCLRSVGEVSDFSRPLLTAFILFFALFGAISNILLLYGFVLNWKKFFRSQLFTFFVLNMILAGLIYSTTNLWVSVPCTLNKCTFISIYHDRKINAAFTRRQALVDARLATQFIIICCFQYLNTLLFHLIPKMSNKGDFGVIVLNCIGTINVSINPVVLLLFNQQVRSSICAVTKKHLTRQIAVTKKAQVVGWKKDAKEIVHHHDM
ncbi:unnamed protein product [Cylicocyclus nassatus]|uniref:Uncharacterized protein n=1 Tax=Cylicocyclus nassatus TaxID=53992 RepID=A0AA36GHA3_CYLNA|nr:unnamed protein product [Cylicocyclus nassatus]